MGKQMTAVEVRRLPDPPVGKRRVMYAVGGVPGLHLQAMAGGTRSWILRATVGGRRRDIGLGPFPEVSLSQAREKSREMREQIRRGCDPVADRRAARDALRASQAISMTFDEAARQCHAAKSQEFRNAKHAAQWQNTLDQYAAPVIGRLSVDTVEVAHVVRVLEPIWTTKTETAARLRGRMEAVFAWAIARGYRTGDNPARWKGLLDAILPRPTKIATVEHFRAVPVDEIGTFMAELRARDGVGARALEFAVLTAARSGEVRGATWDEIDLQARTWTVPGERMKAGKPHTIPLAPDAVQLLEALPRHAKTDLLFPSNRGGKLSDATLSAVLKRMNVDATVHGFRSTFSDWCSERTAYPAEVREMALAHAISDKTERAYRRGDLLQKRRRLMEDWAAFCRTSRPHDGARVTPLRASE